MNNQILINDILRFENIENLKVRFNKSNCFENPINIFKDNKEALLDWQFWNYSKKKSFKQGEVAIGFVKIEGDKWLLFDVSLVTKDLNLYNGVGYEYETLKGCEKYFGRIVIEFKNKSQNMIRKASSVLNDCKVVQILEDTFDNDIFPGYDNVNISWKELERVINKSTWKTALENQKGVYLITDTFTGKKYIGSAYGDSMLHSRWSNYINNGHGGNKALRQLVDNEGFEYVKNYFKYSILDIYKSTIDKNVIINRESWWKETLLSRKFGYNEN